MGQKKVLKERKYNHDLLPIEQQRALYVALIEISNTNLTKSNAVTMFGGKSIQSALL